MVNFIQAADSKIKINEDVSYLLNDALHVNAVFTATGAVTADNPVLRVNLPNVALMLRLTGTTPVLTMLPVPPQPSRTPPVLWMACTTSPSSWVRLLSHLRSITSRDGLHCPEMGDVYGFSLVG